jgi:hypothetical protein
MAASATSKARWAASRALYVPRDKVVPLSV